MARQPLFVADCHLAVVARALRKEIDREREFLAVESIA